MRIKKKDITGNRYGKLVALYAVSESYGDYGATVWRCRCDCGKEVNVTYSGLLSGNNKSCGCLKEESQKNLTERLELVDGTCVDWLEKRKMRTDNKSGHKGVFRKKSGRYSASIGFKKKVFYLGTFDTCEEAIEAREKAEEKIFGSFLEGHRYWKSRVELDPEWGEEHPFRFEVEKQNGDIIIHNSMEKYMDQEKAEQNNSDPESEKKHCIKQFRRTAPYRHINAGYQ